MRRSNGIKKCGGNKSRGKWRKERWAKPDRGPMSTYGASEVTSRPREQNREVTITTPRAVPPAESRAVPDVGAAGSTLDSTAVAKISPKPNQNPPSMLSFNTPKGKQKLKRKKCINNPGR